jgi:hypothetical protein
MLKLKHLLAACWPTLWVTRKSAAPPFAVFEVWGSTDLIQGGYRCKEENMQLKMLKLKTSPVASVRGFHPLKGAKDGAPSVGVIPAGEGCARPSEDFICRSDIAGARSQTSADHFANRDRCGAGLRLGPTRHRQLYSPKSPESCRRDIAEDRV